MQSNIHSTKIIKIIVKTVWYRYYQ